ncbi:uncharacterized protein DUF5081 [Mobilisporobacter senegalensis]|uniref:Uncharacterized protein DUF5081 n=1 Tax=Mobilisporobacter senegalensis TaxID=1329262 RepID=A0A3N1Y2K2_9FIRM|nr:DUF5081 family protein [Mobilisporobacter senegalensis]ROR31772.1 uncharacterized protein DUF5081 [Mobilisporobacter senegalensis]
MISLTLNEIKTLNRAIDNKSIIGIKNSGNPRTEQKANLFANAKASMIKKGVLKDFYHFTAEGALIFGRLKKYKEAKRHIEIQGIWMGIYDETITIVINPNDYDAYEINTIFTDSIIKTIEKKYDFVNREGKAPYSNPVDNIDYRDISNKYLFESKGRFRLSHIIGEKMKSMLFFYDGNERYYYDSMDHILYKDSADMMNDRITRLIGQEA